MPPATRPAAPMPAKKKAPIIVQIAAVVIVLPTALGLFAVASQLLSGFSAAIALVSVVMLVVLIAAFMLFSMKRWALYVVTVAEVVVLGLAALGGGFSTSDLITVAAVVVCWVYYKSFV